MVKNHHRFYNIPNGDAKIHDIPFQKATTFMIMWFLTNN